MESILDLELGTPEAAVRSCVSLIAAASEMKEAYLAYWLDLYYQVRARYEAERGAAPSNIPAIASSGPPRASAPTVESQAPAVDEAPADDEGAEPIHAKLALAQQAAFDKRRILERLLEAKRNGVTVAQIVAEANGGITDEQIRGIIAREKFGINVYRVLEAALDRICGE